MAFTENTKPEIANCLAESYEGQRIFTEAYRYFFKARNAEKVCACMIEVAKEGYESELDLFYARACIDMLVRVNELAKTKYILE